MVGWTNSKGETGMGRDRNKDRERETSPCSGTEPGQISTNKTTPFTTQNNTNTSRTEKGKKPHSLLKFLNFLKQNGEVGRPNVG